MTGLRRALLRGQPHADLPRFRRSATADNGIECVRIPIPQRAPDCNAFAERWVLSAKKECLNGMIFFGIGSLHRALAEYVAQFNAERPHQGIGNSIPAPDATTADANRDVVRRDRLGGVLRHYHRAA